MTKLKTTVQDEPTEQPTNNEVAVQAKKELKAVGMKNPTRKVLVFTNNPENLEGVISMSVGEYLQDALVDKKFGVDALNQFHYVAKDLYQPTPMYQNLQEKETEVKMCSLSLFRTMKTDAFSITDEEGKLVLEVKSQRDYFIICKVMNVAIIKKIYPHLLPINATAKKTEAAVNIILDKFKKFSLGNISFTVDDILHFPKVECSTEAEMFALLPESLQELLKTS